VERAARRSPDPALAVTAAHAAERRQGLFYVCLAVLFFSTSAVLARRAGQSLGPAEIAFWRLAIAGPVVLLLARVRRQPLPAGRARLAFAAFGLAAALHFLLYIASLYYTTVAHTLSLLATAPIFVVILSRLFLGERVSARRLLGVLLTVAGVAILTGMEPAFDRRMLLGDALALASALAFAFYSIAGRSQRTRYGLFAYAGSVYAAAALWLLPAALFTFSPGGYTPGAVASLLALALVPLTLGHTLFNAALRRTSATVVNVLATQEVTLSVLLALIFLGEQPAPTTVLGMAVTLAGVLVVLLSK
jgi:drug/metabolite transporter (DMT)-like permease